MDISIIILTKNSAGKIHDCLESVKSFGEIIILDGGSTDDTLKIVKQYKARVFEQKPGSYDTWRNQAKEAARGIWLFYIDPDERVTPQLRQEILSVTGHAAPYPRSTSSSASRLAAGARRGIPTLRYTSHPVAYAIPRRNFVFGKELKHGGWYPDYVLRLMRKDKLIKWEGELHEQPQIDGEIGHLKNAFIHLKEDNLSDMVVKTNKWSGIEAKLLMDADHPPMVWWRFFRPVLTEVFDRLILKGGFLDGVEGIIFSIYQGYSRFATYAKLWEMQQNNKS